jgi:hypothetical protein
VTFSDKKMNESSSSKCLAVETSDSVDFDSVDALILKLPLPPVTESYNVSTAAFVLMNFVIGVFDGSPELAARLDDTFRSSVRCREAVQNNSSLLEAINKCAMSGKWETLFTHSEYGIAENFSSKNCY